MKTILLTLAITFIFSSLSYAQTPTPTPTPKSSEGSGQGSGRGNGIGNGMGSGMGNKAGDGAAIPKPKDLPAGETMALRILSKPRPAYTDAARENEIQGNVTLRVTFLASGEIGSITPVSGLPYGLTEKAIEAARQIKFDPMKRNGVAVAVTKAVQYSFTLYLNYFEENDKALSKKAEIIEMPLPELLESEIKDAGGKITLTILLQSDGTARLIKPNSAWSKELAEKIKTAVAKIKFNPAIDQNEKAVNQSKEIEYVFPE